MVHLRGLAPGQHSFKLQKSSQQWRVIADAVINLPGLRIEPQTSRTDSDVSYHYAIRVGCLSCFKSEPEYNRFT